MTTQQFMLDIDIFRGRAAAESAAADARAQGWSASVRFLFGNAYEVRKSRLA